MSESDPYLGKAARMNTWWTHVTYTSIATLAMVAHGSVRADDEPGAVTLDFSATVSMPAIDEMARQGFFDRGLSGNDDWASLGAVAEATFDAVQAASAPATHVEQLTEDTVFQISLALWAPGIDGTIGVAGLNVDVSETFIDIMQESSSLFGFGGSASFRQDKFGGYLNGWWCSIKFDENTAFGTVSADNQMGLVGFGASYEVGRWAVERTAEGDLPARDMTLDAYVGARYSSVEIELDLPVLPNVTRSRSWIDPLIGARLMVPISQDWSVGLQGDIGGFGAASDLIWSAAGVLSWDFHIKNMPSSLQFGYMAIADDYSAGSGIDQFEWDVILHGLLINWQIRF